MRSERGTALITVLWIVLIISIIALTLAASVRAEITSEMDSFDSDRAFFMAKGAAESMFSLFVRNVPIPDDGPIRKESDRDFVVPFDTGEAHVHFESAAGLIDLNSASDKLLAAMFDSLGVTEEQRNRLVDSILDWKDSDDIPHLYGAEINDYPQVAGGARLPKNALFDSVEELLQVKNMTPELFNGSFGVDPVSRQYRRIPGVRELLTVDSQIGTIDVNDASIDVLKAVPEITPDLVQGIITERATRPFTDSNDVLKRVPRLTDSAAQQYLSAGKSEITALVSRATVSGSGAARTVRMVLKREQRVQILGGQPLQYRNVFDVKLDHWQF